MKWWMIVVLVGIVGLVGLVGIVKEESTTPTNPTTPTIPTTPYHLTKTHDSLYHLNEWALPYPIYQFQTGDIDGDGNTDAMVGVIKSTRFYPEKGRRLFIFKQVKNKVRPMWLGSRLGAPLLDFRYIDRHIRSLEQMNDTLFAVAEYSWSGFGMKFEHYLIEKTDSLTALKQFKQ